MFIDLLFLLFVGISFYWGYQKGIIYSVFSLLAYFVGIVAAIKFSSIAVKLVHGALNTSHKTTAIIAFLLVFILVVVLVRLIAWGLEQVLKTFSLTLVNKVAGGAIHALIGLFVFCLFAWFLDKWKALPADQKHDSHSYKYVASLAPDVMRATGDVVPMVHRTFDEMEHLIDTNMATDSTSAN